MLKEEGWGGNASADRSGVKVAEVEEDGLTVVPFDERIGRDYLDIRAGAGRSHPLVEYAAVAHHDQALGILVIAHRQQYTSTGPSPSAERHGWCVVFVTQIT